MANAKYKDLTFDDFTLYDKVPPVKTWASKLIEDFIEQDVPVIGIDLEDEHEAKNRQMSLNKAIRDNPEFSGMVKTAKRGTAVYLQRVTEDTKSRKRTKKDEE